MPCCSSNLRRSSEVAGFSTRRRGLTARTEQRRRAKWNSQYGPNLPGGPNPVPTSSGGWGHEKLFKINGVPNLTPWSQPFAIHSCGRTKNVGKTLFYTKRVGPPLGTPRLGPHSIKPLICSGKTLSQPLRRLGPHATRLGPGAHWCQTLCPGAIRGRFYFGCVAQDATSSVDQSRRPTTVSLHDEHTDPCAGRPPRAGGDF